MISRSWIFNVPGLQPVLYSDWCHSTYCWIHSQKYRVCIRSDADSGCIFLYFSCRYRILGQWQKTTRYMARNSPDKKIVLKSRCITERYGMIFYRSLPQYYESARKSLVWFCQILLAVYISSAHVHFSECTQPRVIIHDTDPLPQNYDTVL